MDCQIVGVIYLKNDNSSIHHQVEDLKQPELYKVKNKSKNNNKNKLENKTI